MGGPARWHGNKRQQSSCDLDIIRIDLWTEEKRLRRKPLGIKGRETRRQAWRAHRERRKERPRVLWCRRNATTWRSTSSPEGLLPSQQSIPQTLAFSRAHRPTPGPNRDPAYPKDPTAWPTLRSSHSIVGNLVETTNTDQSYDRLFDR